MPKQLLHRRSHRRHYVASPPASFSASAFLTVRPRKVSFEEAYLKDDTASSTVEEKQEQQSLQEQPKRTLARPKSSMSLVDLARGFSISHEEARSSLPDITSTPVSPIHSIPTDEIDSLPNLPASPWGQFVEMVESNDHSVPNYRYARSSTECRRNRTQSIPPASPYKNGLTYKKEKCFLPNSFNVRKSPTNSKVPKLSPRKTLPDQIIGALEGLQFR